MQLIKSLVLVNAALNHLPLRGAESPSPPKAPIGAGYREDWSGIPAQPYLYPALIQNKDTVKELCTEELNQEIRRLGGRA